MTTLGQIDDHMLDVGLRDLALLLLTRLGLVSVGPRRVATMRSRRRFTDSAVIALRLKRLRDLQHMAQTLVLNDGTLIDFSQTIVLPAAQHAIVSTKLDPSIRVTGRRAGGPAGSSVPTVPPHAMA
ncbi:hypothetical protein WS50_29295 [Burkholderia territorii]|nr:hypothetical protein WS47_10325 [Burkholderia territorii]KUZ05628.1 hypothetical protein WS50_29295 [Burkholderia territorii]